MNECMSLVFFFFYFLPQHFVTFFFKKIQCRQSARLFAFSDIFISLNAFFSSSCSLAAFFFCFSNERKFTIFLSCFLIKFLFFFGGDQVVSFSGEVDENRVMCFHDFIDFLPSSPAVVANEITHFSVLLMSAREGKRRNDSFLVISKNDKLNQKWNFLFRDSVRSFIFCQNHLIP